MVENNKRYIIESNRNNNYSTDKRRSKLTSNLDTRLARNTLGKEKSKYSWQYFNWYHLQVVVPPPPTIGGKGIMYSDVHPSVRPSINTYFAWRDISSLSGGISMKLATNVHHVGGHCWKSFQGRRSKVKVTARPNSLLRRRHTFRRCGVEDHLFYVELVVAMRNVQGHMQARNVRTPLAPTGHRMVHWSCVPAGARASGRGV